MKPRLALFLAVGSALALIALAARGTSPVRYQDRPAGDDEAAPPVAESRPPLETDPDGSAAAGSLVVFLIVLVAAAVIGLLWLLVSLGVFRWRRKRRGVADVVDAPDVPGDDYADPPPILVRRAAEALEELRGGANGPPGDAVIAAWLTLERAARDSGVPRQGHQTTTEFTGDLLRRYRVDERAAGALRGVYQRARFGTAEVTAADARTATEALERIVRDLR